MFLKRIRIENVRAIAELALDFQGEEGGTRKWTLLLGENGAGKSTLLRCAALLLCGRDALPELLGPDPSRWIRTGQPSARIEGTVATAAGDEPVRLELHRSETIAKTLDRNAQSLAPLEDEPSDQGRSCFVAGYGASRRLGRAGLGRDLSRSVRAGMVRTLFDADATLRPLASWAMDLHYSRGESTLELIRSSLGELLPGVTFRQIDKTRRTFDLRHGRRPRCARRPERRLPERRGVGGRSGWLIPTSKIPKSCTNGRRIPSSRKSASRLAARTKCVRAVRALSAAEEDLGLNREELRRRRWHTYEMLVTLLRAAKTLPARSKAGVAVEAQVQAMLGADREYAAMARYFARAKRRQGPTSPP